ncbi:MAG: prepilin peptidase [Sphingomonadaceae bacterium]
MSEAEFATPLLLCSGAYASWSDFRFRRLSNPFCLALAALGLLLAATGQGPQALASQLGHAIAALVAGFALFAFGVFGGGDAKYYAAVAAWFPLGQGMKLLGAVSLGGLIVVAFWYAARLLGKRAPADAGDFAMLPFGIAIALGGVATAWTMP